MKPNAGRPVVLAVAVLVTLGLASPADAQIAYTANTVQSLYYKEIRRDSRIYVFNNPQNAQLFEASGEIGRAITKVGVGPNGETVVGDSETALELFFFKYGIADTVDRPKDPPFNIVWRDGKTRMTLGSDFYLELSNRVQVRYTHEFPDEAIQLPGTGSPGDSKGSFRIRRAKLKFEGWFYKPWLTYEVQTNWPGISSSNLANFLEDANINWDVTQGRKRFMLKLGQFKVPFGLQELTSSGSQQLVDRAFVSNQFFRGRDTGLSVWGVLGSNKLEYRAGIFNGAGQARSANDNDKFQYNARVTWQPNGAVPLGTYSGAHQSECDFESAGLGRPIFTLSAAFEQNDLSNVNPDLRLNTKSTSWEVDALFKYKGFFATGEYAWGKVEPQAQAERFDRSGWFLQAGYFLKPQKWEIAARYGRLDPSDLVKSDQVEEFRAGLNYFHNRHALKVQTDFGWVETERADGNRKSYELRLQTQVVF